MVDNGSTTFAKRDLVEQKFDMVSYQIAELGKQVAEMKGSMESSRRELSRSLEALITVKKLELSEEERKK